MPSAPCKSSGPRTASAVLPVAAASLPAGRWLCPENWQQRSNRLEMTQAAGNGGWRSGFECQLCPLPVNDSRPPLRLRNLLGKGLKGCLSWRKGGGKGKPHTQTLGISPLSGFTPLSSETPTLHFLRSTQAAFGGPSGRGPAWPVPPAGGVCAREE